MPQTKVVISKKFNGAPVRIYASSQELGMEIDLNSFINHAILSALPEIVAVVAANAGSPAMLITNAQLVARLKDTVVPSALVDAVLAATDAAITDLKLHSVMAE